MEPYFKIVTINVIKNVLSQYSIFFCIILMINRRYVLKYLYAIV